jgi:hypothetical protein
MATVIVAAMVTVIVAAMAAIRLFSYTPLSYSGQM